MSLYESITSEQRIILLESIANMSDGICDWPYDIDDGLKKYDNWKEFFEYVEQLDILDVEHSDYKLLKMIVDF